ncbi:MAG: sodium:pantothenate symporter [Legionellales bacterium]|nr:sodium:pantothenate symporter [Legionellales bacterium]
MNLTLFVAILVGLGLVYIALGKQTSKHIENQEDYYLSGRGLGFFSFMITCLATQLGGAAVLGAAEEAYLHGWAGLLYAMGVASGFVILALGVGSKIRQMNVSTVPELIEKSFGSRGLRELAGLASVISLFLILVAQAVATRKFFAAIHADTIYLFFFFWIALIFYTVVGGLRAVVSTDKIQALFILGGFLLVMGYAVMAHPESVTMMSEAQFPSIIEADLPWLAWVIMPMLFTVIGQDMGQRCSAASEARIVSSAMVGAAVIYVLFAFIPVGLGLFADVQGLEVPQGHSILMASIAYLTTPEILSVAAAALLMAIISTADSLLCAISSNVAQDFSVIRRLAKGNEIRWAKVITFVTGISAVALSFMMDGVIPLLIEATEPSIFVLFVPILLAIFFNNPPKSAAVTSIVIGLGGYVLGHLIPAMSNMPYEAFTLALAFLVGFVMCVKNKNKKA